MRLSALLSGGKDSLHAALLLESTGFTIEEALTIVPEEEDAWLFHTPNLPWVALQAEAWRKPHRRVEVAGRGPEAELEGLRSALAPLRDKGVDGVTVGAIGSSYQWSRLQRVGQELGLKVFAPLWRMDGARAVREEIQSGLEIRIVQVASEPLEAGLAGRTLDPPLLEEFERRAKGPTPFHVAGEGGEYETFVTDAPPFRERIEVEESRRESRGASHRWTITRAKLVPKPARGDHEPRPSGP